MHRFAVSLIALALTVATGLAFAATSTPTLTPRIGKKGAMVTLEASTAASIIAVDDGAHGLRGKTGWVGKCTVNGQEVFLLLRLQDAPNGLFLDVLASDTAANLDTLAGSLDLATVTSSTHPSPTEDACDTALIADAQ